MIQKAFALARGDKLLGLKDALFELSENCPVVWTTPSAAVAEYVRRTGDDAKGEGSSKLPLHFYDPDELHVRLVEMKSTSVIVTLEVPTWQDWARSQASTNETAAFLLALYEEVPEHDRHRFVMTATTIENSLNNCRCTYIPSEESNDLETSEIRY